MKSITSLPEFITWAKEVNLCPQSTKRWCDLQDIFAHSIEKDLIGWYVGFEAEPNRRILLFGVYKCMGDEPFMRFVNATAVKTANERIKHWEEEIEKEFASRMDTLREKEQELGIRLRAVADREKSDPEWRKAAYKKIRALREVQEKWAIRIRSQEKEINDLYNKLAERPVNGKPKRMISV